MDYFKLFSEKIKKETFVSILIKIILILLVLLLLKLTYSVWVNIFRKLFSIFLPFIIGFIIAFIIRPIIVKYENDKISRKLIITVSFLIIFLILIVLLLNLIPTIYSRLSSFINTLINSINYLYLQTRNPQPNVFLDFLIKEIINFLNDTKMWLPNITNLIPQIFSSIIYFITNIIFAIIIGIYMSLSWEKISNVIKNIANKINKNLPKYLYISGFAFSEYFRALTILMIIKFFEYSILYYFIGHKDWIIMGFLTSVGLLIPYFGATIANTVGILTSLTLPLSNTVILIIFIVILSFVDAYLIAPIVHSKNSKVEPLWTLFCVFAGGVIMGPIGVMISIPIYMCIRAVFNEYRKENTK